MDLQKLPFKSRPPVVKMMWKKPTSRKEMFVRRIDLGKLKWADEQEQ
jgi:hypothetical protein